MLEFAGLGVSVSCGSTTFGATEASTVERYDSAGDLRSARRGDVFFSADSAFAAGISTFIFAVSAEVKEAAAAAPPAPAATPAMASSREPRVIICAFSMRLATCRWVT